MGFENPDGGVWKQGWDIRYDESKVRQDEPRLEVIVVPHSHCDPGWIKTFERYYDDQVKAILDGALAQLSSDKDMKFIYAEVSFFERWWRGLSEDKRARVRRLLQLGKFEIVTGGWVMTDEANSHFYATVDQLMEGHQWLEHHLGFKPRHHWSIDPFGLSATMPALLSAANFSAAVVQRVHYRVKHRLAKQRQLEFLWRPLWKGADHESDLLTHMFPFYSYDVPHTCGPDPKVCCQFDFRRLPGNGMGCPWNIPPQPITAANVAQRAATLLDQYRKKAQLYASNVLLIPLGDDFRYDTRVEWDAQYDNYKQLFDHINSQSDWNAHARFGTLADYFAELGKRMGREAGDEKAPPVLSGDFFTYADRDDHYWSGYYTSRPLYKRMDRALQSRLRAAEIALSLAVGVVRKENSPTLWLAPLFQMLVEARRAMGLFQHHDGVTGTAKDPVVRDYGQKMLTALQAASTVLAAASQLLLSKDRHAAKVNLQSLFLELDERRPREDALPEHLVLSLSAQPTAVFLFNSLPHQRSQILCLHTNSPTTRVLHADTGKAVPSQLNPLLYHNSGRLEISSSVYQVFRNSGTRNSFIATSSERDKVMSANERDENQTA